MNTMVEFLASADAAVIQSRKADKDAEVARLNVEDLKQRLSDAKDRLSAMKEAQAVAAKVVDDLLDSAPVSYSKTKLKKIVNDRVDQLQEAGLIPELSGEESESSAVPSAPLDSEKKPRKRRASANVEVASDIEVAEVTDVEVVSVEETSINEAVVDVPVIEDAVIVDETVTAEEGDPIEEYSEVLEDELSDIVEELSEEALSEDEDDEDSVVDEIVDIEVEASVSDVKAAPQAEPEDKPKPAMALKVPSFLR